MTSTALRTRGIRRNSQRQAVLQALADAGGSMEYDDFRRFLAKVCPSKNAMSYAISRLRAGRLTQHRVHLTASGSALLAKTAP